MNQQSGTPWRLSSDHRTWLQERADELFAFFQARALNAKGGFHELDLDGHPVRANSTRGLHSTARMVHCFSIASLLGRERAGDLVDHGMRYLWERHRDGSHGGYYWALDDDGVRDESKQGYGHAFVLLAASSAKVAGHPDADRMIADVSEVIEARFWEEKWGAIAEEFETDWTPKPGYHGQNSNMHMTEALMAAFEATCDSSYLHKAERIADLIVRRQAGEHEFRVAEHFDHRWGVDKSYSGHEMFRPSGITPGHWAEWSRLLLQLYVLGGRTHGWMPEAARRLFSQTVDLGWDEVNGGLFYTLGWDNNPTRRNKLWWPMCEALGAAAFLCSHSSSDYHEAWYRRIWDVIDVNFIDRERGGWHEELTEDLRPSQTLFAGKGDIYHALQACLIPLYPASGSLTQVIASGEQSLTRPR